MTRPGSARGIRCDEDTESGVNGLSLVNGDRTFSVNATSERADMSENLTALTLTLRDAVDVAHALISWFRKTSVRGRISRSSYFLGIN